MKRLLAFIFLLLFILTTHSENTDFSRWSFAPEYGYNKFDGDISTGNIKIIPSSFQQITYGATLEYGLTPIWGFSLDYYFFPLKANNNSNTIRMNTDLYTSDINATVNFTRLFFPQSNSKFYVNGALGLGYAYYTFNAKPPSKGVDLKDGTAFSIPITLSIEYNLSKTIAFGTKVQYRALNKDDLEGVSSLNFKGNSNDFIGSGTLFLRYKFQSIKKNHLRNIKMDVFSPDNGLILGKINAEKINKLNSDITKLEEIINYQNRLLDSINVSLAKTGTPSYGEEVTDIRGLENNSSFNTQGNNKRKLLKIKVDTSKSIKSEDVPAVYFDFNKIELDKNALQEISKIAIKMKADPSLYVEVRGYCDNLDNEKQNNLLSQRRSDRVKAELVNYWKIPYNHIITTGKGDLNEPQLKYRKNRRCDIFFVKL